MQVNAINSFSNVNFEGKHRNNKKAENNLPAVQKSNGFMSALRGPVAAIMFVPLAALPTSCTDINVSAKASATVEIPGCGEKPVNPDIKLPDALDSLYHWTNNDLDIPSTGGDGNEERKVMSKFYSQRGWEYNAPETYELDLENIDDKTAVYDHSVNNINSKIYGNVVEPGSITVVDYDGNERDDIGGIMFTENGIKQFIHSNGKNQLIVYKQSEGDKYKFEYRGIVSRGVLPENEYGKSILLMDILSPGTGESLVNVKKWALGRDELLDKIANAKVTSYTVEED